MRNGIWCGRGIIEMELDLFHGASSFLVYQNHPENDIALLSCVFSLLVSKIKRSAYGWRDD
jgi:hypothetical protein